MERDIEIFEISPSTEDDRPQIAFDAEANQRIDWQKLDGVLRGQRPIGDYDEVRVSIPGPRACSWGFFSVPGTLGLISAIAVDRIGHSVFRHFDLLPAKLNDATFYFLKPKEYLPCLDREKSEIITFRADPGRVKEIRKYSFNKNMLSDPLVFSIPEALSRLYATTTVYNRVVESGIPGFRFSPVG